MDNQEQPERLQFYGDKEQCPFCKSENIKPVHPFDYIKQCKDCGEQFPGEHN